jgi:GNAT superfamily N-acetyltransferase
MQPSCSTATTASAGANSGAPDEVPRIKNRAAYEKGLTVLPDWRIACNFVGKGQRRQGVATAALAGALDLIADLGGGRVEGYPEDAGSVPAGFLYDGALSTYESLGFVRDRKIGKHRWVVAKLGRAKLVADLGARDPRSSARLPNTGPR